MITITEQPANLVWSKNPMRYQATTDTDLDTDGFYIRCKVYFNAALMIEFAVSPDATGAIAFDIRNIINALLRYDLPTQANAVTDLVNQYGDCYVTLHEVTTATPEDPDFVTSNVSTVLKGGLNYETWDRDNYFSLYDNSKKVFLTWYESGRKVAAWQAHWLTYLHLANTSTAAAVVAKIYYTDGTDDTVNLFNFPDSTATQNKLYRFPAGINQLELADVDATKDIWYYDIKIMDDTDVVESFRFYCDYDTDYEKLLLHYFSSIGGFESLRLKGETEMADNREAEATEPYTSGFNASGEVYTRTGYSKLNIGEQYKSNIGATDLINEQDLRREIFYSPSVYRLVNSRWWPVQVLNKNVSRGKLFEQVREMSIEWAYGFTNENYTPSFVTIGTITCALSIAGVIALATAPDPTNVGYSVSWINVGGTPASVQLLVSTDGGATFAAVPGAVQVDDTHYTYTLGSPLAQSHIIRLIPMCGPSNPGVTSQVTYTPIACALTLSDIVIEIGTAVDYFIYHVSWVNGGGTPDSMTIEVSTDGGTTWAAPFSSVQTDDQNYTYSLGSYMAETHMVRLTPMCSPTSAGTPGEATYTADPDVCTRFVPEGATTYDSYDTGFEQFIFYMADAIAGPYHRVGVEITRPDTSVSEYLAFYGVDGGGDPVDTNYWFSVADMATPYGEPGLYKFRFRICCTPTGFVDLSWGPYTTEFLEVTL
jgi:hypothetical protein